MNQSDVILHNEGRIIRHGLLTQLEHWAIAVSGILLIFTGFGQFPIYKRYMLDKLPGLSWTSDFMIQLNLHMAAAALFTFAVVFHLVSHYMSGGRSALPKKGDLKESVKIISAMISGKEEPPSHKFLAEQRLAYAFIGGVSLLLIVTGMIKVLAGWGHPDLPYTLLFWNTMLHNLGTVLFLLGILAHMGALLVKSNWPLVGSMFHRKVSLEYAGRRHPLWLREMESGGSQERKEPKTAVRLLAVVGAGTGLVLGAFFNPLWYLPAAAGAVAGILPNRSLETILAKVGYRRI